MRDFLERKEKFVCLLLLRSRFIGGCNYSFEVVAPLNAAIHLSPAFKISCAGRKEFYFFKRHSGAVKDDLISGLISLRMNNVTRLEHRES